MFLQPKLQGRCFPSGKSVQCEYLAYLVKVIEKQNLTLFKVPLAKTVANTQRNLDGISLVVLKSLQFSPKTRFLGFLALVVNLFQWEISENWPTEMGEMNL